MTCVMHVHMYPHGNLKRDDRYCTLSLSLSLSQQEQEICFYRQISVNHWGIHVCSVLSIDDLRACICTNKSHLPEKKKAGLLGLCAGKRLTSGRSLVEPGWVQNGKSQEK